MNYIFVPSLRHAANVRVASMIHDDREIQDLFDRTSSMNIEFSTAWELVEFKMAMRLSPFLTSELAKGVAKIIRPMHGHLVDWKRDHAYLMEDFFYCSSVYLVWNTNGTINRTETAKKLLMIDNLSMEKRFKLACTYFLENEILSLWQRMDEDDRSDFISNSSHPISILKINSAVRFWVKRLEKEDIRPWRETAVEYFENPREELFGIPLRVSSFFHLLSFESKESHIESFDSDAYPVHTDDWENCLNGMYRSQRIEIFNSSTKAVDFLKRCLKWPFRPLFLKMAKEAFDYLPNHTLESLLHFVFSSYYDKENEDYHLFKEIWHMSPSSFKDIARENKHFLRLINFKFYIQKHLKKPLEKFVNKCYFG